MDKPSELPGDAQSPVNPKEAPEQSGHLKADAFPVVAIGASAGGLEALQTFFHHMPNNSGVAFIVVTHQHPGHTSMLPELLATVSRMPVVPIHDGLRVQPNIVYVGVSGVELRIHDLELQTVDSSDAETAVESPQAGDDVAANGPMVSAAVGYARYHPIDRFFRSLAYDQGRFAVCIVLSGTGTDGTLGLQAIKAQAGMVMVQGAESAKFDGMPASAIATGLVDFILPVEDLPKRLLKYVADLGAGFELNRNVMPEEVFKKIFTALNSHTGNDFSEYKKSTLERRIERRMSIHSIETPDAYADYLRVNPHEVDLLFKELLISVTNFFRDPPAWQALRPSLLALIESRADHDYLRVWIPGCATGEEAYSMSILIAECLEELGRLMHVQIFATDLDEDAINKARSGRYGQAICEDVSAERMKKYFDVEEGSYRVCKDIRETVIFATQNVIKDPPFTKLDVISCRNLLIYMKSELQARLLPTFHYALKNGGLLLLGSSESIGDCIDLFELKDKKWKIYQRKDVPSVNYMLPKAPLSARQSGQGVISRSPASTQLHLARTVERMLLSKFAPVCIVVNQRGDIVYIQGRTGKYLEPAQGQPQYNLIEMAREGLRLEVASLLRQSMNQGTELVRRLRVKTNGAFETVEVLISIIDEPESLRGLQLVCFSTLDETEVAVSEDLSTPEQGDGSGGDNYNSQALLKRELLVAREDKQIVEEEFLASTEELKSANEELQSTNEELQSTNEELETSKDEMQSLNEELITVNSELESKVYDLSQVSDDMQNLLNSTEIATVFVNTDLSVKRFTEEATKLISLRQSDIGRPIRELMTNLLYDNLLDDLGAVLKTLKPKDIELRTREGAWYFLRIMPYRTVDNVIDGVVCTFTDIGKIKRAESLGEYFECIVNTLREPILVLNLDYVVVTANAAFYKFFQLRSAQVQDERLFDIGGGQWDIDELKSLLKVIVEEDQAFQDFKVTAEFARIGQKRLLLNARRLGSRADEPNMILLAFDEEH